MGSIEQGAPHDRAKQEALALAYAKAASKVRKISESLSAELTSFARFWSLFDESSYSSARVEEHARALLAQAENHYLYQPGEDGPKIV